jgi:hypothetical protein
MAVLTNPSPEVLNRLLTIRQWAVVNEIENLVDGRFKDIVAAAGVAHDVADKAYIRTVAEVNANPRYQELLTKDTKSLSDAEYQTYTRDLAEFTERLRGAEKARLDAANKYDDLLSDQETAYAGTCLLAGEISGFRMGLEVFASMLANPRKWGITAERPAAAVMVELVTNDVQCLETIHQLMGDVVYTPEEKNASSYNP